LGGHNDLLAGFVVGPSRHIAQLETLRGILGGVAGPQDAYALLRGLKTLDLRVRKQNATGQRIAETLQTHPAVRAVHYPGLASHPDHAVAKRLMAGYGGVVSFEINGDVHRTSRFVDRLKIPFIGPTLGGVESIVQQQALFLSRDPVKRASYGISDSLVRYAAGIEDADDLIADLIQALDAVSREAST